MVLKKVTIWYDVIPLSRCLLPCDFCLYTRSSSRHVSTGKCVYNRKHRQCLVKASSHPVMSLWFSTLQLNSKNNVQSPVLKCSLSRSVWNSKIWRFLCVVPYLYIFTSQLLQKLHIVLSNQLSFCFILAVKYSKTKITNKQFLLGPLPLTSFRPIDVCCICLFF